MGQSMAEGKYRVARLPKKRGAKKRHASEQVLVHDCFDQASGEKQPNHCPCVIRISEREARRLIEKDAAQWLLYKRCGKSLQNKKSLVLLPAEVKRRAHSHDALNHKLALSIQNFEPIATERIQPGIDPEIMATILLTIKERTAEVVCHRNHYVHGANGRVVSSFFRTFVEAWAWWFVFPLKGKLKVLFGTHAASLASLRRFMSR